MIKLFWPEHGNEGKPPFNRNDNRKHFQLQEVLKIRKLYWFILHGMKTKDKLQQSSEGGDLIRDKGEEKHHANNKSGKGQLKSWDTDNTDPWKITSWRQSWIWWLGTALCRLTEAESDEIPKTVFHFVFGFHNICTNQKMSNQTSVFLLGWVLIQMYMFDSDSKS